MINAAISRVKKKKYPENRQIMFIEDRLEAGFNYVSEGILNSADRFDDRRRKREKERAEKQKEAEKTKKNKK